MAGINADRWPVTSLLFLLAVLVASVLSDSAPMKPLFSFARNASTASLQDKYDGKVQFMLYTRKNPEKGRELRVSDPGLLTNSPFDPLNPTKIIVHGWLSSMKSNMGGTLVRRAILSIANYNVITVDWSAVDSINYIGSRKQVPELAKFIGQLVWQLQQVGGLALNDLHLIGHSLGAHIMGLAARSVNSANEQTSRITGLDPAGPLFWDDPAVRLDKSDAAFVDVLHTCAGWLGYNDPVGHADFYPNGGKHEQPGCNWDLGGACSHCRAFALYLEALDVPNLLVGTQCDSYNDFLAGRCSSNGKAELGLGTSRSARGKYFFKTNSKAPYSTLAPPGYEGTPFKEGRNFGNKC